LSDPKDRKAEFIRNLFSGVPEEYDFLLRLLSLRQDSFWRNYTVANTNIPLDGKLLDIATGTGVLAYHFNRVLGNDVSIIGLDLTPEMIKVAKKNNKDLGKSNVEFIVGRAEALPFRQNCFDAATISLAMRNVTSVEGTISEMVRTVNPDGRVISIDFRKPSNKIFLPLYYFYLFRFMPFFGRFVSKNWENTFRYLARSIDRSLHPDQVKQIMASSGLRKVGFVNLTGGVVALVCGQK
jgi:demethylmenaquinone methyltransferase/2-methoxy-6-polyprenyl-1,4-benzoquinol methylase